MGDIVEVIPVSEIETRIISTGVPVDRTNVSHKMKTENVVESNKDTPRSSLVVTLKQTFCKPDRSKNKFVSIE